MVTHQPAPNYANRTTLIVAPPGLIPQWLSEIGKHTENNSLGDILRYHAGTKPTGNNPVGFLEKADIVITTYNEVMSSYPKFKPPADALSHRQKLDWWKEEFEARRGPLHRMKFFRVILDEAQVIRNHKSQTSIGCRALMADHYWAISGTPILNRVEELYPYFKFLRVKHTGDIEVFKENFCEKDSGLSNQRLHSFLRRFMMRRTHKDSLFGAPIVSLPKAHEETIYITFNEVERTIYQMIHKRYFETFNGIRAKGTIRKEYKNILVMLLRLRQFTAHMFLCQETLQDLLTLEDIEKLWAFTVNETKPNNPNNLLLKQARKLIIAHTQGNGVPGSENSKEGSYIPNHPLGDEMAAAGPSVQSDSEEYNGKGFGLNYRFRKYLRNLRTGEKWDDLRDRSLCHRCQEIPDEPQVTSCMHVYCNECILVLSHEASRQGLDQTSCLECGEIYTSVEPCYGISELDGELRRESMDNRRSTTGQTPSRQDRKKKPDVLKWINMEGSLLPSAKTVALKAQILLWFKEKPDEKIIIYTQFRDMISIMSKICQLEGWESREYSGRMSYDCREKSLEAFATNKNIKILISSLKCGGVGLNLTMASRVLCVDLWWNSSVEQQAFCRIFRIGQERETYITRFVVRNSIDEKLLDMQKEKSRIIDAAIGDSNGGRSKEFTVDELLHLFGPVREEEDDGKEFIIVDDDVEEIEPPMAEGEPPILTNRDSLSRRRGKGRAK
ncbi:MAG: hypothetical protein M1829_004937 [Trizodia sp. TS-e1964]|nr:MAG: hypothetical protein M1829_004937 [Trizodia sp. TS-e1964]